MIISPNVHPGYRLLHEGAVALSEIESNGILIDRQKLDAAIEFTDQKVKRIKAKLRRSPIGRKWQKRFGVKMNFKAREQLGAILFTPKKKGGLGLHTEVFTKSGKFATDEQTLKDLGLPFIKRYLLIEKYEKAKTTYLIGIRRQLDSNNLLHAIFNLHTVMTYRSSSDSPNFQNMPIRNPVFGRLIREVFIARPGCVLIENDFKGVEVGVSACYNKDPSLIRYLEDETKDMHRDSAMDIYIIEKKLWARMKELKQEKAVRHVAKNKFVFPEFYGSWWAECGKNLWDEIGRSDMKVGDVPMKEHLAKHGITELGNLERDDEGNLLHEPEEGQFLYHIKKVEGILWNKRFPVYRDWRKSWYKKYLKKGYFKTYTGFTIGGDLKKNQVINFPVQGSAFHCLLWTLIQVQKELKKRKMGAKIVGQIHDSILADVPVVETDEYLAIVRDVVSRRLREHYKWIIVPLEVECEICPIGGSWYDKREVKINKDGTYTNKEETYTGSARGLLKFWKNEKKKTA